MSLVAALLVGSSAFAVDNVKVNGDVNLFYMTADADSTPNILAGDSGSLFAKDSSAADASLNLAVSADLVKNDMVTVSGKAAYTVLSTLGLENNFVSNVWGSGHTATVGTDAKYAGSSHSAVIPGGLGGAKVENANYFTEAYLTIATGNSALQLGRMELDTPLAFTETWSAEKNTFEAAVVMNKDIPDTTIVAAYIGNGNGNETFGQDLRSNVHTVPESLGAPSLAVAGVVNADGDFGTFGTDGAYALAVVNNSFKPLTAQAWYYRVTNVADAFWVQADVKCSLVEGLMLGAQYSAIDLDAGIDSDVFAVMAGYEMKDVATLKVAYSQTGEDFGAGFNTATSTGASKVYTESWWSYGYVTQADTTSYNVTVESPVNGLFDLGVYYTFADQAKETGPRDLTEFTVTASKSFGPLDATLAVINTTVAKDDAVNSVQAYLKLNF